MSSFQCPNCGTEIIDSPTGYETGCEHYPLEKNMTDTPSIEARAREYVRGRMGHPQSQYDVETQATAVRAITDFFQAERISAVREAFATFESELEEHGELNRDGMFDVRKAMTAVLKEMGE